MTPEHAVMPADSAAAVLDGIRALATERNWAPVSGFLDALAPSGDRAILVAAAPGLDPVPVAAWLSVVDRGARCRLASLTQLAEDPGRGLAANRVVLTLKCGDLLMPSSVAGASTILARPACCYLVLLAGVEIIESPADLAVVERAIWQAPFGPAGQDWAGQDLSAHRCLMWADPADPVDGDLADPAGQADGDVAVPGFLAERFARDRALALDWLLAEVRPQPALQRARAVHALGLARRAGPSGRAAARLAALGRLLSRPSPEGCPGPQSGDSLPGLPRSPWPPART